MELEQILIDKIVEKVCKNYDKYEWTDNTPISFCMGDLAGTMIEPDAVYSTEIGMQTDPNKWYILLVLTKTTIQLYSYNYDYHEILHGCIPTDPGAFLGTYADLTSSEAHDDTIQNVKKNVIAELFNVVQTLIFRKKVERQKAEEFEMEEFRRKQLAQVTKVANDFLKEE